MNHFFLKKEISITDKPIKFFIIFIAFLVILFLNAIFHFDEHSTDNLFKIRQMADLEPSASSDIIIFYITRDSYEKLAPEDAFFPRKYLARAIEVCFEHGAKGVVIDKMFDDLRNPDGDKKLAEVIKKYKEKIVIGFFNELPAPIFYEDKNRLSYLGIGMDEKVRNIPKPLLKDNKTYIPISFMAFETFFPNKPYNNYPKNYINYPKFSSDGFIKSFDSLPIEEILLNDIPPGPCELMDGRVIFIGEVQNLQEKIDVKNTPLGEMSGVEIQCDILNTLIYNNAIKPVNFILICFIVMLLMYISWALLFFLKPVKGLLTLFGLMFIIFFISIFLFIKFNITVNYIFMFVGILVTAGINLPIDIISKEKENKEIKKIFGQQVSNDVMEYLLIDKNSLTLGGELKEVTILFSDIRGFTTFSEKNAPHETVLVLNEYLTAMTNVILENQGTINKFLGDGILAVFGAPKPDKDHALHAVITASKMQKKMIQLNLNWKEKGGPCFETGIGIHSGQVITGNVGSPLRMEYTVIGDTVNLASRLESLNKEYKTKVIISKDVAEMVGNTFELVNLGTTTVKGKTQSTEIFTLKELMI